MINLQTPIISKIPSQKEIQFLEDRIYEYNSNKIKEGNGKMYSKLIYDSGAIVAGIAGWIWAGACEITLLWVHTDFRNKGYGLLLLRAAEEAAQNEACRAIVLRTYSFQAPGFYQKHGYTIEHETKDFPYGYSDFCMIKRFGKQVVSGQWSVASRS